MTADTVRPCDHCQTDGIGHRDDCPRFPQPIASMCGCVVGMGHMDRNCHSYGLCRSVGCRRCKGEGWTGPSDRRPGATCDDCNGTGDLS